VGYANFSQGFRAPNLQEATVLGDTGSKFEVPNGSLAPETSNTVEVGLRSGVGVLRMHLAGFVSFLDDVIDERSLEQTEWQSMSIDPLDVGDKPVVQRVNSARGRYLGAEATIELGPFFRVTPWARVSWIRGEIETGSGETHPARRVPPLMGAFGLRYHNPHPRFFVEAFSRFAARQNRLHPSDEKDLRICENPNALGDTYADAGLECGGTAGWWTLNARGGYVYSESLRFDASLNNLTNALYRYHGSGVDAPGVGALASVVVTY
jgi:outer membrane receptor protein involved in Fe transport